MRSLYMTLGKVVTTALVLLLLLAMPLSAQGTPLYRNFGSLPEVDAAAGFPCSMSLHLSNESALKQVTIPLKIYLSDFINVDSISYAGSRFDGLGAASSVIDNVNHTMVIDFLASSKDPNTASFLPPGVGDIATIYLSVASNATPGEVRVDTTQELLAYSYQLVDTSGAQVADYFVQGVLKVRGRAPVIHLEPTVFNFFTVVGNNPGPDTLHITNLGVDPLNWHITHKPDWLSLSDSQGTAPSNVGLNPIVAAFPIGELHDSIAVTDTFAVEKSVWAFINVTITQEPVATVAGTVQDTLGVNLAGATVELWDTFPGGTLLNSTTTDGLGKFGFLSVPNGNYVLYCTKTGYYPKTEPFTAPNMSILVKLTPLPSEITTCIPLKQGWNLISWNLDTPDDGIETIIANIKGCVDVIMGFEQGGATYDPFLPQFSTLNVLDHLHGYWFRMLCDTTLCVTGMKVSPDTPIDLEKNWNLVSYLPDGQDSTQNALASMLDKLVVALGFDNGGMTYDPAQPNLATLHLMKPTFGYWLKTTAATTLIYPAPFAVRPIFNNNYAPMPSYRPAPGITATPEWVDLFGEGITLDGILIPAGAVLAAYDENGHLCGQAVVGSSGRLSFTPIYRDDKSTQAVEGPDYGGKINLTINGTPVVQSVTFTSFGDRIRLTSLTSLSKGSANVPRNFELAQNYPNPFNPGTSIEFSLPTMSRATVEVFNVVGEKVATLIDHFLPAGRYTVDWDGLNADRKPAASGMYFYRLSAGDFTETKKMMLVK